MEPLIVEVGGVGIFWYGLAYASGFLGTHLWMLARRHRLGGSVAEVHLFSLVVTFSVLAAGRLFDVFLYEWGHYGAAPLRILALWGGGMASHGLLLGAAVGTIGFCRWRGWSVRRVGDEIVFPAAVFLALGRIANHINGEVYGFPTDVPWAVTFPYAAGPRHPVALYEAAKNLALVPLLLLVARRPRRAPGVLLAHFVFWYASLRFLVDLFRDYDSFWLGIGRGQYFNLLMATVGAVLLFAFRAAAPPPPPSPAVAGPGRGARAAPFVFYALVLLSLPIPSGWTQEVLETMRARLPVEAAAAASGVD